jgi:undecaprenyl-diphosphatase
MSIWQAIILGLVQGLTEFLPVSSSGHLVLGQYFLGLEEPQLQFDIMVHLATLFAVAIFFFPVIIKLRFKEWLILAVGTIPAALIGIFFKDIIERLFAAELYVACELLITAGLNFWADRKLEASKNLNEEQLVTQVSQVNWLQALIIGGFQAVAISPGISRSGATLVGGLQQKLDRQTAFTFSFLLSLPAVAGAVALQLLDVVEDGGFSVDPMVVLAGGVAAFISGYASLWIFKKVITSARLEMFGWYCLVVGGGSLIIILLRG